MPSCTCHDVPSSTRFVPAKLPGVPDESFGYLYDDIGNRTSAQMPRKQERFEAVPEQTR